VTLPLSLPGIIAGTILVFIPAMGMFVVPDLLGGAKTILVGNLIRNQFLTARDWPLGAAASMILLVSTLLITLLYTRKAGLDEDLLNV
jgi:spermidine/putrescine transport system permease protein